MPTFIKAGFWEKLCVPCKGYKGWLNLTKFVQDTASEIVGPPGPTGPQGPVGPQGPIGNTGPQGIQGETGAALTVLGSYPDLASFLAGAGGSPGTPGTAWIIESDGSLYVWNTATNSWEDVGDLQGPPGPQGIQGIQGVQGVQGVQGIQGVKGDTGLTGAKGDQGIQGIQGTKGDKGDTGSQGIQGVQGNPGTNGTGVTILGSYPNYAALVAAHPTGSVGDSYITDDTGHLWVWSATSSSWVDVGQIVGPQGPIGPQGPKGDTGATGATGSQGIQGIQGIKGDKGDTGATGAQGIQGIQGPQGIQGISGAAGGYRGSFYDTTTQTTAGNENLAVKFNNTDLTCTSGFSIVNDISGNPTQITAANTGIYNLQFSAQLNRTSGGGAAQTYFWIRINGVDVPETAGTLTLANNGDLLMAAWNYFLPLTAGQNVQLMWRSSVSTIRILYNTSLYPTIPHIPSVIATICQVG